MALPACQGCGHTCGCCWPGAACWLAGAFVCASLIWCPPGGVCPDRMGRWVGSDCHNAADKQLESGGKAGKVKPLLQLMKLVGTFSGGRSVTQVALAYLISKGAFSGPERLTLSR